MSARDYDQEFQKDLALQQKRVGPLQERAYRLRAELDMAAQAEATVLKELETEYKTTDAAELRKHVDTVLAQRQTELAAFTSNLDQFEQALSAAEKAYQAVKAEAAG